jgi:hypothetical protein
MSVNKWLEQAQAFFCRRDRGVDEQATLFQLEHCHADWDLWTRTPAVRPLGEHKTSNQGSEKRATARV